MNLAATQTSDRMKKESIRSPIRQEEGDLVIFVSKKYQFNKQDLPRFKLKELNLGNIFSNRKENPMQSEFFPNFLFLERNIMFS
jgi:hypothetical protein